MNLKERIEELLPRVQKPARYIGSEYNMIKKSWEDTEVRVALAFPDTYEIGMSHLGSRILYSLINAQDFALCERVYSPWVDMEKEMIEKNIPLFTLESFNPLKDFDIIGISLQYELTYTNVLNLLHLAGIPLLSVKRDEHSPLVIAGGPCTVNPEPMADYIDVFLIGDGEEAIIEILTIFKKWKKDIKRAKHDLLMQLSRVSGIYVPKIQQINEKKKPSSLKQSVLKRKIEDLDAAYFPEKWIVPNMGIVHDRIVLEVVRGCFRKCRFCQAGYVHLPVRRRKDRNLLDIGRKLLSDSGYEEISLSGLSICDYPGIENLVKRMIAQGVKDRISVALPSSRIDNFSVDLLNEVQKIRKTGITFAPESGSERLRRIINKEMSSKQIIESAQKAFKAGWLTIKLYFMIGLPGEHTSDLEALVKCVKEVLAIGLAVRKRITINVTIANFIPKPHTPFQWAEMESVKQLMAKQDYLLSFFSRNRHVHLKFHDPKMSIIEAILARGDRKTGHLVLHAWKEGCRFDGWADTFDFSKWLKASENIRVKIDDYLKERNIEEKLPWDYVDVGVKKKHLMDEYKKAMGEIEKVKNS